MEIKINYIPHNFRNKYLKNTSGYASSSSSFSSTGGNGLPYVLDENGNYVVEKQVLFKKSIISKEEVVAYGEDNIDYVGTYAPLNHPHGIDDITGLKEILDNIEVGSGGTGSSIEVVDNLESTSSTAALSARQGKVLSELIADKTVTWDTLQNKPATFTPSAHSHTIANVIGLQGQLDSKASSSHTHTIANVTNLQAELNKKSDTGHSHDDRYYTETEVNNLLAAKASSSHIHSIANITGLQGQLDGKASSAHTHTIANITNLEIELNNKANNEHTHAISAVTGLQTQLDSKVNSSDISTLNVKNSDTVDNLHASSFMRSDTDTTCTGTITCANLIATGEVTSYSDKRLKTDIQSLDNRGLLNPVTYLKNDKRQIGFIAQDVQEVYPELVNEDANGYLSLNYQQLTAVLSSQINDLYSLIDELKLEISRLKNK